MEAINKQYKTIFFDLDHTLWDYDQNSLETLKDIFIDYGIEKKSNATFEEFFKKFNKVNDKLWANYNRGLIDREVIRTKRFQKILRHFKIIDQDMTLSMSSDYIKLCPQKTNLMPYAIETLEYLLPKYPLYLLTNGFDDVQEIKIAASKIGHYFKGMVTSETSGYRKPSTEIFDYTLNFAAAKAETTIMIGDNLAADITGAKLALLDTVFYNPKQFKHKTSTDYEVNCLSELTNIL
jgi:YjjG family noncanonical pyrimidine nucleotidase